ncbi:hypothetical protein MHU86_16186 [Fragilaria crotonensis]|nr:hypothetical protein MHU86_16186 [Fragilaria crotonensis]
MTKSPKKMVVFPCNHRHRNLPFQPIRVNFDHPIKKKQRPVTQTTGRHQELDTDNMEDLSIDEVAQTTTTIASEGHDDSSTNRSLEDVTTDLESRYNTQTSLGGGSPL